MNIADDGQLNTPTSESPGPAIEGAEVDQSKSSDPGIQVTKHGLTFTVKNASSQDKLDWEVTKLIAETRNLQKPWILQPASWITILSTSVALIGGYFEVMKQRSVAATAKIDLKGAQKAVADLKGQEQTLQQDIFQKQQQNSTLDARNKAAAAALIDIKAKLNVIQSDYSKQATSKAGIAGKLDVLNAGVQSASLALTTSTLWIEIAKEGQRGQAGLLKRELSISSVKVDATENVGRIRGVEIPRTIEIRYGRQTPLGDVERVKAVVDRVFPNGRAIAYQEPTVTELHNIQIWFPNSL